MVTSESIRFIFRTEESATEFKKKYKLRNAILQERMMWTIKITNIEPNFKKYIITEKERNQSKLLFMLDYLMKRRMSYGLLTSEHTAIIYLEEYDKDFKRIFTKWTPEVPHSLEA